MRHSLAEVSSIVQLKMIRSQDDFIALWDANSACEILKGLKNFHCIIEM